MKLERMNEQQIRCTLTSEDLTARKLKISELAYGTDKARSLFRDMMIKAADELDFEVEEEPLMIFMSDEDDPEKGEERNKSEELRCLWRKAIHQQILLLRMEKENQKLEG